MFLAFADAAPTRGIGSLARALHGASWQAMVVALVGLAALVFLVSSFLQLLEPIWRAKRAQAARALSAKVPGVLVRPGTGRPSTRKYPTGFYGGLVLAVHSQRVRFHSAWRPDEVVYSIGMWNTDERYLQDTCDYEAALPRSVRLSADARRPLITVDTGKYVLDFILDGGKDLAAWARDTEYVAGVIERVIGAPGVEKDYEFRKLMD